MARLKDLGKVKDSFFISVDKLIPDPEQPREDFNEESIAVLANLIYFNGQETPISVRMGPSGDSAIIVHGERRWRAVKYADENFNGAKIGGLYCVAENKINGKVPTDEQRFVNQITNNEQIPLTAIEKAKAYKKLIDKWGYKIADVAKAVHRSDQHIRDMLKILELPEDIQDAVDKGALAPTTATKTAKARDDVQKDVHDKISRGEKVKGVDVDNAENEPLEREMMTPDEIRKQIKIADKNFCLERTDKGRMKYKGMVEAFRIVLREEDKLT